MSIKTTTITGVCMLAFACGSVSNTAVDALMIDGPSIDSPGIDGPSDAAFDPTDDLIVHYPFENDVFDTTANANHGTIVGTPTFADAKTHTRGVVFNNPTGSAMAKQWVQLPSSTSILSLKARSFTVSICYESSDSAMVNGRLFGNTVGIALDYNSGTLAYAYGVIVDQANTALLVGSEHPIVTTDGNWHCQVIVLDRAGGEVREFVDATLTHDTMLGSFGNVSTNDLVVGAAMANDTFAARMTLVDDLRIYDRALTASEITQLYNLLKP